MRATLNNLYLTLKDPDISFLNVPTLSWIMYRSRQLFRNIINLIGIFLFFFSIFYRSYSTKIYCIKTLQSQIINISFKVWLLSTEYFLIRWFIKWKHNWILIWLSSSFYVLVPLYWFEILLPKIILLEWTTPYYSSMIRIFLFLNNNGSLVFREGFISIEIRGILCTLNLPP